PRLEAAQAEVGAPAHQHDLGDLEGERDRMLLRDHRQPLRKRAPCILFRGPLRELEGAAIGPQHAARHAQQRGLPRACAADQADQLSLGEREVDAAQHGAALERHLDPGQAERAHVRSLRAAARRSRNTNRGPPASAVIAPTGSSRPPSTVRATVSHSTRKAAPPRAEAGRRSRWSGPTLSRSRCGMMRPTKPIRPETETAAPTMREVATSSSRRTASTGTPSCAAGASPRARRFSARPKGSATARPSARNAATQPATSKRASERFPISQRKMLAPCVRPAPLARNTIAAEANALKTTPVSRSVVGERGARAPG